MGFSAGNAPGMRTALESEESQVFWAVSHKDGLVGEQRIGIDSTAVDAGNTPTTTLRGGNLMALKDSDSNAYVYNTDANDGTQGVAGVLGNAQDMLQEGAATDRFSSMMTCGLIKRNELLGLDAQAEAVMTRMGFKFDDITPSGAAFLDHPARVDLKITDYTVTAADNGRLFVTTTADTNYTLPTIAVGLSYEFWMLADFELVITGSNNMILKNAAAASTLTYTTGGQQIGAWARVLAVYQTTTTLKWLVKHNTELTYAVA